MCTFRDKLGIVSLIKLLYIVFNTVGLVEGILNGKNVNDGEFTYQVAVLINGMHACGGAILNSRNVMSGGQCVLDEQGYFLNVEFRIIYGVSTYSSWGHREQIKVEYIYILHDFRPTDRANILFPVGLESGDLSILQLEREIPLGSSTGIKSVILPKKDIHRHYHKYTYATVNVSGFGLLEPMNYKSSSNISSLGYRRNLLAEMHYIGHRVERKDYCYRTYPQFAQSLWIDHICSISDGVTPKGVCFGDVGGPLILDNLLIGVMQIYAAGCDDRRIPAIFTRLTEYMSFVNNVLKNNFDGDMRLANYTGASVNEIIHESRRG